jgi:transcription antitermination protein NusB
LGAKLPQSTPPAARPQREPRPGVAEQRRPSTRRTRRSRARGVALQVLYEDDLNPQRNMATSAQFLKRRLLHDPELVAFAQSLVDGVRLHRAELDRVLTDRLQNWSLQRMAVTDRNVLRLGIYEILFGGTPGPVAINEAVELARRFGSQHSAHFVNGVLDRVFRAPGDR